MYYCNLQKCGLLVFDNNFRVKKSENLCFTLASKCGHFSGKMEWPYFHVYNVFLFCECRALLSVCFCTGHFFMVPLNLTISTLLAFSSLNISLIYIKNCLINMVISRHYPQENHLRFVCTFQNLINERQLRHTYILSFLYDTI